MWVSQGWTSAQRSSIAAEVGEEHRRVGSLPRLSPRALPVLSPPLDREAEERAWWDAFDPTQLATCRRCSFLPVCWAGCPKRHLDGDAHAVAEQGAYWRRNLARLVADGVHEELAAPMIFDQSVQFRD